LFCQTINSFDMNTLAYILYLLLSYFITVHVGLLFYRNGRIYILNLLQGDEQLTGFINKMLLVGYYLLNLGYAALMISSWNTIYTFTELVVSVCTMTGRILLTLAAVHFCNMAVIYLISKKKHYSLTHKN
jgi:hypothetical protein